MPESTVLVVMAAAAMATPVAARGMTAVETAVAPESEAEGYSGAIPAAIIRIIVVIRIGTVGTVVGVDASIRYGVNGAGRRRQRSLGISCVRIGVSGRGGNCVCVRNGGGVGHCWSRDCRALSRDFDVLPLSEHGVDDFIGNSLVPQINNILRTQIIDGSRVLDVIQNYLLADLCPA